MATENSPAYLRGLQRAVMDFRVALENFLELHVFNDFLARGTLPAVLPRDDADETEIARRQSLVSRAAGRARRAPRLTGVYIVVQGAGRVDPIAAWQSMTIPKPLLEPNDVLGACDQMVGSIDDLIFTAELASGVLDPGSTGDKSWRAIDNRLDGVVSELATARTADDLQDVGRRCREILIAAAKLLADDDFVTSGEEPPKGADGKAWIDLFLTARAGGSSFKDFRKLIRATWDAAQGVTHANAERVEAYAAAQATVMVIRTLQQLSTR